jgi:hypothetical protein
MATWGEFIQDVKVRKMNPGGMMVAVDDAIELWEERRKLREEVAQLREEITQLKSAGSGPLSDTKLKIANVDVREACAREVEEFAEACAAEGENTEVAVAVLRACARMIRERALEQVAEAEVISDEPDVPMAEPVVPMAEPVHEEPPPE